MNILLIRFIGRKGPNRHIPWHYGFYKDILEVKGHKVDIIDNSVEGYAVQELVDIVLDHNYDIVGTGGMATIYNDLKSFTELLKKKREGVLVIVGGHVVADSEFLINTCPIDIIVFGEGDITLPKILSCIESKDDLDTVPGIAFKRGDKVVVTEKEKQYAVMDDLPVINPEGFKLDKYKTSVPYRFLVDERAIRFKEEKHKLLTFTATRGCTHSCFFCYRHLKGHRSYSKERLEENIKILKEMNCSFVWFNDENITANKIWLKGLCELTKKYEIYWTGSARADHITHEVMEILKDSNCCDLFVGVESFDPKMLKQMYKRVTPQQNIAAINLLYQYGLTYMFCMIIGTPGEDRSTIFNTRKGIWSCYFALDFLDMAFLSPYPGSPSYHFGLKNGYIKDARYVHELLLEKNDLVINFSKLSNLELIAWHSWICLEFAISYRVKHSALSVDQPFLDTLKKFIKIYCELLFKESANFFMFNLYIFKGFSYWLKPVKKLKWAEFRKTLVAPKRLYLRHSLSRRLKRLFVDIK